MPMNCLRHKGALESSAVGELTTLTLNPSARRHCLCASISCLQSSDSGP